MNAGPVGPEATEYRAQDDSLVTEGKRDRYQQPGPPRVKPQAPRQNQLHRLMRYIPPDGPVLLWAVPY